MAPRTLSPQARLLLAALLSARKTWRHGYDLSQETGLKSGTLYPLLIRLEEAGALESAWEAPEPGRPPRHVYRLTAQGQALANAHPPVETSRSTRRAVST